MALRYDTQAYASILAMEAVQVKFPYTSRNQIIIASASSRRLPPGLRPGELSLKRELSCVLARTLGANFSAKLTEVSAYLTE